MTTNVVSPLAEQKWRKPKKGKTAMHKQTAKLVARIAENLPDMSEDLMQNWIDNPKGLKKVLQTTLCPPELAPVSKEECPLDPLIHVDRTIRPTYPDWVDKVMHPELELTGPAEFDVAKLEQWLHPDQVNGLVKGDIIYKYLKTNQMLVSCLNLRDLEAIQEKGLAFFRQHFHGKAVFAWKSVVLNRSGNLRAPYLVGHGGKVILNWFWLDNGWSSDNPALRFASN